MKHDVFISYSSKDKEIADAAYEALKAEGIDCWIDSRSIPFTQSYAGVIDSAIPASRIVLLILSLNSNSSKHVLTEIDCAMDADVPILPWRIEDAEPTGEMRYYLRRRQRLDALSRPIETHIEKLVEVIKYQLQQRLEVTPEAPQTLSVSTTPSISANETTFEDSTPDESPIRQMATAGAKAKAQHINDKFVVLKGSTARKAVTNSLSDANRETRQKLVAAGQLIDSDNEDFWVFTEDVPFKSSSAAASVIAGSALSGPANWRDSGQTNTPRANSNEADDIKPQATSGETPVFELSAAGTKATAQEVGGQFVVLKDSTARKLSAPNLSETYVELRRKLVASGQLADSDNENFWVFTENVPFKSSSAAAVSIVGNSISGPATWKVSGSGQTYKQWSEQQG